VNPATLRRLGLFLVLGFAAAFVALSLRASSKRNTPGGLFESVRKAMGRGDIDVLWSQMTPAAREEWGVLVTKLRKEPDVSWAVQFREMAKVSRADMMSLSAEELFRREVREGAPLLAGATLVSETATAPGTAIVRFMLPNGSLKFWRVVRRDAGWAVDDLTPEDVPFEPGDLPDGFRGSRPESAPGDGK
jgi:hypothetical protein